MLAIAQQTSRPWSAANCPEEDFGGTLANEGLSLTWQMAGKLQTALQALLPGVASETRHLLPPAIQRQSLRIKRECARPATFLRTCNGADYSPRYSPHQNQPQPGSHPPEKFLRAIRRMRLAS